MSGFGVLTWIAMGSVVGWTLSRLMVVSEDDALRGTAAGMIGAILGGLGSRMLDSAAPGGNQLNAAVAALAASLWLTWLTCVATSGRRRDDGRIARVVGGARSGTAVRSGSALRLEEARQVSTYAVARNVLVDQLLRDAMAHDAERYEEVGRRFDTVERRLPRGVTPELARLRVALTFWDAWIDARNQGWQPDGGIAKAEWPFLARSVAADLEGDRDVTNVRVVTRFDAAAVYSPPGNRVQALAARLRAE
jgi:uncharacterized membrane protein YeaQ/YmgE (transglycosylase-associated protein family)